MSGYDSYLAGFKPAPPYTREVLSPWEVRALFPWMRKRGGMPETEARTAKILSAADGAKTYKTASGGYMEVMQDKMSGEYIIVEIAAEHAQEYKDYQQPLPFWAWSMG